MGCGTDYCYRKGYLTVKESATSTDAHHHTRRASKSGSVSWVRTGSRLQVMNPDPEAGNRAKPCSLPSSGSG